MLEVNTLESTLETNTSLLGTINNNNAIDGIIENTISIKGTLDSNSELSGVIENNNSISGTLTIGGGGSYTDYDGSYDIIPKTTSQTLNTTNKIMRDDVLIEEIPYFETSNEYGNTIYIGSEVHYGN